MNVKDDLFICYCSEGHPRTVTEFLEGPFTMDASRAAAAASQQSKNRSCKKAKQHRIKKIKIASAAQRAHDLIEVCKDILLTDIGEK